MRIKNIAYGLSLIGMLLFALTFFWHVDYVELAEAALCRALVDCSGASNRVSGADYNALTAVAELGTIQAAFGGTITAGDQVSIEAPYSGTITASRLVCDATGSIVIDVWVDTYANYPPTNADSITASATPTLADQQTDEDTTLTGWTTSISSGNWLIFNVDSVSTVTECTLSLSITKTGT